jgi:TolA-binding protein|tara:strand:+ start:4254 stop:5108 length:855 start_codon:yes stop_codon:yes gene_type:complete
VKARPLTRKIIKSVNKVLIPVFLIGLLNAQESDLSEIFFLDLGIVIEPANGSEIYSRLVDKPSKEVSFKIKKVESGSVYMASSNELLTSLDRINDRIKNLESSLHSEINELRNENKQLRQDLSDIQESKTQTMAIAQQPEEDSVVMGFGEIKEVSKETVNFDHSAYMSGVFAYQREDYKIALKKFSSLALKDAPEKTADNILYWMADSYQQDKQYIKALELLNQITSNGGLRIDDALIQKGLLHRKMGNETQALTAFTNVVSNYPKSEYLRLAQLELKKSDSIQ